MSNGTTNTVLNLMPDTLGLAESWRLERAERLGRPQTHVPYGISFLDDCFLGLQKDDLVVLGARTGQGKTQIAIQIAVNAAMSGRKVLFFALESTRYEIARRLKFRYILPRLIEKYGYGDYLEWVSGIQVEDEDVEPTEFYSNIKLVFRMDNFGIEQFNKHVLFAAQSTDLVILDHLHYLDLEGSNENEALKHAVKFIRQVNLDCGKACLLLSHIRKRDKREKAGPPDIEDLHGSSEISKMATQVFTFESGQFNLNLVDKEAPGIRIPVVQKGSLIRSCKFRADGSRARYTGLLKFDTQTRLYSSQYALLEFSPEDGMYSEVRPHERPRWARHAF